MWKAWNQMLTLMINWIMTTISRDLKKINLFGFKEQFYTIELSLLFCFVSSTLEQVLRRGIWTLFTEVSCGTLIILRSTSMKQNVEIVEYISHVPNITSDMVKCFTPVRFPKISILPEKRVNCDISDPRYGISIISIHNIGIRRNFSFFRLI